MAEDADAAVDPTPVSSSDRKGRQRGGVLSRVWRGIFRGRGEDYEERLRYLSREEAAVHARMKRRAQRSRQSARNIVVFSVIFEVVAVTYAVITTRSPDLNWQIRAMRVLPMFLLPALSSAIYSILVRLATMFDHKDQKILERLRAERQTKIDELKERTNYYTTQQLIQRYDLDPAAKAAAATVLASKLGADTGLKVYLGDDSELQKPLGKSSDVELVQLDGLRNRKQAHTRQQSAGSDIMQQFVGGTSPEVTSDGQEVTPRTQRTVEHYKYSGTNDGGWIARFAAMLVGEDPTQCYALICGNCHMHNGLARKEDFPYITYYCPHCHALSGPRHLEEHGSGFSSGKISPPAPSSANTIVRNDSSASSVTEGEVTSNLTTVQEEPVDGDQGEESGVQAN